MLNKVTKFAITCLTVALFAFSVPIERASAEEIDLTGEWYLTTDPNAYWVWEANLTITQTSGSGNRHSLSGSFYWTLFSDDPGTGTIWGWEDFADGVSGTESYFDEDAMTFHVEGYQLRGQGSTIPGWVLVTSTYDANVLPSGNSLTDGYWAGADSQVWTASRVPEPATMSFFALGGLALLRRRRRTV